MTLWSIRSKFNKVLEGVRDSPCEIKKLNTFFDDCLNEQHQRHNVGANVNSDITSTIPVVTQREISQHTRVSDPINPVTTKGRPKAHTRIKPGLETSLESKKRKTIKCSYCGGQGHNITSCQKKKVWMILILQIFNLVFIILSMITLSFQIDEAKDNKRTDVPVE